MNTNILATAITGIDNPKFFKFEVNCEFLKNGEKCKDYFILYSKISPVGLDNHEELTWFLQLQFKTSDIEILSYQVKIL